MALPSSSSPPPPNPVLSQYESFVSDTPLVTRYALTLFTSSYLLSFVAPNITIALINIPHFTIFQFELYRLVLSPFICFSFLNLIFGFICFLDQGKRLEYALGSTAFAWLLLCIGVGANVIYTAWSILMYLMWQFFEPYLMGTSGGLWMIIFGILSIESALAIPGSKRRLFVAEVPALYYPLCLYGLFAMLGGGGFPELVSVGIGYAFGFGKLNRLKLTLEQRRKLEGGVLRSFTTRVGWIVGSNTNNTSTSDSNSNSNSNGDDDWSMILSSRNNNNNTGSGSGSNQQEQGDWSPTLIPTRHTRTATPSTTATTPQSSISSTTSKIRQRFDGIGQALGERSNNTSNGTVSTATRRSNATATAAAVSSGGGYPAEQSGRDAVLAAAERRAMKQKRQEDEIDEEKGQR